MADFTPQQLQAMQALIAGTFDKLDTTPKIQPGYSLSDIYSGMYPPSGSTSSYASTFPSRPEVPFSNTSRDRLQPNANPDIPGSGVAANDWYSKPGSYINQMGAVKVSDLPALKKPPLDITVRGGNAANSLLAMMGGSRGTTKLPQADTAFPSASVRYKTAIGPQVGTVGGKQPATNNVTAAIKPGWKLGDGLLALLTQNMKQPMGGGLGGLLGSLFQQPATAVGSQLNTSPSPSDRYNLANLPTLTGPRSGVSTNGYVYQNGQNVGTTRAAGESAASQYDRAAAAARASSPDNGGNPSWW